MLSEKLSNLVDSQSDASDGDWFVRNGAGKYTNLFTGSISALCGYFRTFFHVCLPTLYLGSNRLVSSMSAVGHCGDNAACEGFFGMLKRERVHHRRYRTQNEARADVFDYIERFHNPRMRRRVAVQDQKLSSVLKPSVETG